MSWLQDRTGLTSYQTLALQSLSVNHRHLLDVQTDISLSASGEKAFRLYVSEVQQTCVKRQEYELSNQ
jgi:hypothetical protein